MLGLEVVNVKVFDRKEGDVIFEGKVSTDILPDELLYLGRLCQRRLGAIHDSQNKKHLESFRGLQDVELAAFFGCIRVTFQGFLYVCPEDNVLRKSKLRVEHAVMISAWKITSHTETLALFYIGNLLELELNQCGLQHLPNADDTRSNMMPRLKRLRLHGLHEMRHGIPWNFFASRLMLDLTELWISSCDGVDAIPDSIGRLIHLEKLTLKHLHHLRTLSEAIGHLPQLKHLWIEECANVKVPKSLTQLPLLQSLGLLIHGHMEIRPQHVELFSRLKTLHFKNWACFKTIESPNANSWNAFDAFCEMLNHNITLYSIDWNFPEQDHFETIQKLLQQNGSICKGNLAKEAFARNQRNRDRALESVLCLLAARKYRCELAHIPKEMILMLAKALWITRCDVDGWEINEWM